MAQQLSSMHHALIQSLLSCGPTSEDEFHAIFSGVTGRDPVTHPKIFNDFLLKINKELSNVQFELRGCQNQYNGRVFYGVVNNLSNDQSKLGTKYSVPQIAFYKAVAETIIQDVTNQGVITNIEALNIRLDNQVQTGPGSENSQSHILAAFKNFSMSQKEKTLNDLIKDQWLCYTSNTKIGLGVRSFLDLRHWFHSNEVPSCDVGNEAGVKAYTCPKESCTVRIHDFCLKKKFSQMKVARVCPRCSTPWPSTEADGESRLPPRNQAPRKRARSYKAEPVGTGYSNLSAMRKRTRACKTEPVDGAPLDNPLPRTRNKTYKAEATQTEAPWGQVPRKLRSCKSELDAAGGGPQSMPSQMRSRRFEGDRVHITIS